MLAQDSEKGSGVAKRSNVVDAIYDASEQGVDILNASLGVCHSEEDGHDCGGLCRIGDEARLATKETGMTIVAAAGNNDHADAMTCPALSESVIGVGGYVANCTGEVDREGKSSQYWLNKEELVGPFCGMQGYKNGACQKYCAEEPWEGNVSYHNAVPEVLAPVIRVSIYDTISLEAGTSFAAPLVAGRIASMVSDLIIEEQMFPGPEEIRLGTRVTSVEIDDGLSTKFCESKLYDHLSTSR